MQQVLTQIRKLIDVRPLTANGAWQDLGFEATFERPLRYVVTAGGTSFQIKAENSKVNDVVTVSSPEPRTSWDTDLYMEDSNNRTQIKAALNTAINIEVYEIITKDLRLG